MTNDFLPQAQIKYRPDIDGLRAVAVLAVVFFHVGLTPFSGGYIGVDVFFVISGFLITGIIIQELDSGEHFNFGKFYLRRTRRLLPALLCTIFVSSCLAYLLFAPDLLKKASESGLAAIFSVSNFYFWSKTDYFDIASNTKPFLHTWSLSVEEQFYLIWPVLAVLLHKYLGRKTLPLFLIVVATCSFAFAQRSLSTDPDGAFYLLPSRAGELAMGGLLNWLSAVKRPSKAVSELLAALAAVSVIAPIFFFTAQTPFPGVNALVPCLGAACILWLDKETLISRALKLQPMVWLGKISYSVYLVHWPLIVLYFAWTYRPPTIFESLCLLLLSVGFGALQSKFVEIPFRYPNHTKNNFSSFAKTFVPIVLALTLFFSVGWYSNGLHARIPLSRSALDNSTERTEETKLYCSAKDASLSVDLFTCQNFRGKNQSIFVWGDSHARHLVAGLSEAYPDHNVFVLYESGCDPQSGFGGYIRNLKTKETTEHCVERNKAALAYFKRNPSAQVILTSAKRNSAKEVASITKNLILELEKAKVKAVWLGDFMRPGISLVNCFSVPNYFITQKYNEERCSGDQLQIERELAFNAQISKISPQFVSPSNIQCPNDQCRFLDQEGIYFRDDHHLSMHGSKVFVRELKHLLPF